jgi:putative flippase GtrA
VRNAPAKIRRCMGSLLRSHALTAKIVRFGLVGGVSGGVFLICTAFLAGSLGLEPKIASAAGYIVSMPANFFGNRQFSFQSSGRLLDDLVRFLMLHGCNILLTMGAMGAAVDILGLHFGFGAAGAIALVPLANFVIMDLWVFSRKAEGLVQPPNNVNPSRYHAREDF